MDPTGGLGLGAGGGAAAAAAVYILDRFFGSGKAVKSLDEKLGDLQAAIEGELGELRKLTAKTTGLTERLFDWHSVADPDDPAGKIWYFSVGLRSLLHKMQSGVEKLLELLSELIQRFDRYNQTMERLITVVEKLQTDVSALGVVVAGIDRR